MLEARGCKCTTTAAACRYQILFSWDTTGAVLPVPAPQPLVQLNIRTAVTEAVISLQGISPEFGSLSPFAVFLFASNLKIIYVNQKWRRKILSVLQMKLLLLLPE